MAELPLPLLHGPFFFFLFLERDTGFSLLIYLFNLLLLLFFLGLTRLEIFLDIIFHF